MILGLIWLRIFLDTYPKRALNVGVAEQNMIGLASGLVNVGFIPIYCYNKFLVQRSFEQIRNDICLHNYKVILIGTSTGFDNGGLGPTHHKLDDIGCLKVLPNLNIYSPSSEDSLWVSFETALKSQNASFIRISKTGISEKNLTTQSNYFLKQQKDHDIIVISHGKMVSIALQVYKDFPKFSLFAMDQIKPLDKDILFRIFNKFKKLLF